MNLFDVIIVQPILNLLMAIYSIVPGGDFGISIVIFTNHAGGMARPSRAIITNIRFFRLCHAPAL